jgi:hypothetical protein
MWTLKYTTMYFYSFGGVWNLVCQLKGRTFAEGLWEQGIEENYLLKRKQTAEGWRKMNNEKLHNFYPSFFIRYQRRWDEQGTYHTREIRNAHKIPEHLNNWDHFRPMCIWEYNIKMDLKEIKFKGKNQIHLSHLHWGLKMEVGSFHTLVPTHQTIWHPI